VDKILFSNFYEIRKNHENMQIILIYKFISLSTLKKINAYRKVKLNFYECLKFTFLQHWIFTQFLKERYSYFAVILKRRTVDT